MGKHVPRSERTLRETRCPAPPHPRPDAGRSPGSGRWGELAAGGARVARRGRPVARIPQLGMWGASREEAEERLRWAGRAGRAFPLSSPEQGHRFLSTRAQAGLCGRTCPPARTTACRCIGAFPHCLSRCRRFRSIMSRS
jgi:hypothetical protein